VTTLFPAANVFESLSAFFDSPIWSFIRVMLVVFLVLMWLALAIWVYKDARRRNTAPGYPRIMALIALLIPYFGPLLYIAVRPSETIDEMKDRELETLALTREAALRCGDCGFPTEPGYLMCPSCQRRLKEPCPKCARPIDPRWTGCPWCEHQISAPVLRGDGIRRSQQATIEPPTQLLEEST
jgi:hypothetical protein